MTVIILSVLLLAAGVLVIGTAKAVLAGAGTKWPLRLSYGLVVTTAAYFTTYCYDYDVGANTHIFGWPVFRVILQRKSPISPWQDYFGVTILLAYPINLVLYLLIPSLVFLWLARRRSLKKDQNGA